MTLYRKKSALTYSTLFSKEGLLLFFWTTTTTTSHGRRKRAKIGESEGKSAREDGESRRWKHAECVPLSLSLSLSLVCIIQNELDLLCALSARILTLSFFLSLSLSLSSTTTTTTESNEAAKSIQCKVCMQSFVSTLSHAELRKHAENKHPKLDAKQCFPFLE